MQRFKPRWRAKLSVTPYYYSVIIIIIITIIITITIIIIIIIIIIVLTANKFCLRMARYSTEFYSKQLHNHLTNTNFFKALQWLGFLF